MIRQQDRYRAEELRGKIAMSGDVAGREVLAKILSRLRNLEDAVTDACMSVDYHGTVTEFCVDKLRRALNDECDRR